MAAIQADSLDNAALYRLADAAVARYPADYQGELGLLCRSENATFELRDRQGRRYALRLHRGGYHQHRDIVSELEWLAALRETGLEVPEPITADNGETVLTLPLGEDESRHAVLFHWIDGDMPTNAVDPRAFRRLGEMTAHLHRHSRTWQPPDGFQRIIWNHQTMVGEQGHWGRWQDAPNLDPRDWPVIEAALARIAGELEGYGQSPDRYGLIHADLRLTNLLLEGDKTKVIDFDDCGLGWYMHDLAAALSFEEHHPRAAAWVDHWLAGYRQIAGLEQADLDIIPTMIAQRRIQLLAWVGSHAQTRQAEELGPDWAAQSVRLIRRYLDGKLPVGDE
ncbi:phosphotransferase enzyme family protein [Chromohalobacter nigrandesensis]|uniref:phosphotransferase enzyme family protein n=1 Tax=Chromohalobacter nigrandesensis TaxID=119863 RepID=UPI001FF58E8B|nr:phosphotransferase [Chromohalobacter nigrandesensis]MCK0744203.1 phosphotransferase [Chromohalobacter nigrandesensis]